MKRVGIVGTGGMGSYHVAQWHRLPVESVGYFDLVRERAEAQAKRFGGTVYDSLDELLQHVDVVDVCTQHAEHAGVVIAAAAAGKHVITEKPMARSIADAEAMIAACKKAGVRLFVAHVVRFFPEFARAKAVLDSGELGTPGVIRTVRGGDFPGWNSWYGDFAQSGDVIMDLAIHDLDYVRWCFGDITRVFARGMTFSGVRATDHVLLTLRFANGAIGHVEGSWAFPAGTFRTQLEIAGSEGVLQVDSLTTSPMTVILKQDAVADGDKVTIPGGFTDPDDDPYYLELKHFLECIESGAEARVTAEDGLAALKVAVAGIESVRTGQVVELATFEEAK